MPQVRASDGHEGNTTHINKGEKKGRQFILLLLSLSFPLTSTLTLYPYPPGHSPAFSDISRADPEVQTTEQRTLCHY